MSQADVQDRPIVTVTEEAAAVIKAACSANPGTAVVRFSVEQDGDQVRHGIRLEPDSSPEDVVFEQHQLTMAVDKNQVPMLQGTAIDYQGDGQDGRFLVSNPNMSRGA